MSETSDSTLKDATKKKMRNFFTSERNADSNIIKIEDKQDIEQDYIETVFKIYKEVSNENPNIGNVKYFANQLKFKIITEDKLREKLKESKEKPEDSNKQIITNCCSPKKTHELVYCMMGTNRLNEIKPYLEDVLPYVDLFVFVDGGSTDGTIEYINELTTERNEVNIKIPNSNKIILIEKEWQDRFSGQRNNYLNYLAEINYNGWVLTSDTDEHFPEETLAQLRTLIKESENGMRYTGVKFHVEDILVDDDNRNIIKSKTINDYWKALMFKFNPDLRYEGEPHEALTSSSERLRWINSELIYQHIRSQLHIYVRAAENYFISNSNRYSERWADFRLLCTRNNILNFKDYWTLFEKHKLPNEIEEWLERHKDDNFDSGDSELRETYLLYNETLPKRNLQKKEDKINNSHESNPIKVFDKKEKPKYGHDKTPNGTGRLFIDSITPPKIEVQTNISTSLKQSEYELRPQCCEQCYSPNEALMEMIIHHKHGITMCKKCWVSLSDYIKKKIEET